MKLRILMASAGLAALLFAVPTASAANLLVNPGFEVPDAPPGGEVDVSGGFTGWSAYGANFVIDQPAPGPTDPISSVGAFEGTQALKNFGNSGVFADFAAAEGDQFDGSVYAINPNNNDVLVGGQIALSALIWLDSGGGVISSVASNVLDSLAPTNVWNLLSVNGTAPAGTAAVRFQVFTEDTGGGGGAPRFDAASLTQSTVIPEPGSLALLSLGAIGFVAGRRRRRS